VLEPPVEEIGALPIDEFLSKGESPRARGRPLQHAARVADLRGRGARAPTLDVAEWMTPKDGRTPVVILSVAHLDDDERALVLGVVLEEVLSWVRTLPGSQRLRALVMFDEVYGFLPPHPAEPPTKRPIVALMKQARAFGVGIGRRDAEPMDLDYRAPRQRRRLVRRAPPDRRRPRTRRRRPRDERRQESARQLGKLVQRIAPRWFVLRDVHAGEPVLMQPRWAISMLRGPMTRSELVAARRAR